MSHSSFSQSRLPLVRLLVILALVVPTPALPTPVAYATGLLHVTSGGAGNGDCTS